MPRRCSSLGLAKTTETTIPNIKAKTRWSYLAVTALQTQHHLGSTLSSKVLRTMGG